MNETDFNYTIEENEPHTSFGKIRHTVSWAVYDNNGRIARQGTLEGTEAEAIEAAETALADMLDAMTVTDDYGLTNDIGMGHNLESKQRADEAAGKSESAPFYDDGHEGEIVVKKARRENTITEPQLPKRIASIDEASGLEASYGGGDYTAIVSQEWDGTFHIRYIRGAMPPHKTETVTADEIEQKMRSIQPDLRRWRKADFANA